MFWDTRDTYPECEVPLFVMFFVTVEAWCKYVPSLKQTENASGKVFLFTEIDLRAFYEVAIVAAFGMRECCELARFKWANHGSILYVFSVGFFTISP